METLDDHVGEILAELEELGVADNTIVVFTTDNGDASGSASVFGADGVWQGLAGAKPGINGLPSLVGGGSMIVGEPVSLAVGNGRPSRRPTS